MNNQEKKQIQSINNKNLRTILSTPDTTPGIALRTETTLADITQEIDIKQINYLLKQLNRGTNEHISNSIWEKKINTVCTHHNIDINHLHTLEKQQQRAELNSFGLTILYIVTIVTMEKTMTSKPRYNNK